MLKRLVALCAFATLLLPGLVKGGILLGNHALTLDLVGTTQYFEFAEFKEYDFPVQGLNWGVGQVDLFDPEYWDPSLPFDPENPEFYLQNRNVITMTFQGNLDIGLRFRTALRPRWGLELYLKYTPGDVALVYNGVGLPAANFKRYSGVSNPDAPAGYQIWVDGDFPNYHIVRFGGTIDYVYYRSSSNSFNAVVSASGGMISYFRSGKLMVAADYDENEQDVPSAPVDISYYMPNDMFPSAGVGAGAVLFLHRLFGLNLNLTATYTPFQMARAGFPRQWHWLYSASVGYTIRFG